MSATIAARRTGDGDPMTFVVVVRDGKGETRHEVTLSRTHLSRLAPDVAAERVIEAAFRFLLDREPKESILARFDVSVIPRYFPEFEKTLPTYLP